VSEGTEQVVSRIPRGRGIALDLGGAAGPLRRDIEERGYRHVNLDLSPSGQGRATPT
jgi:hypothetical protein